MLKPRILNSLRPVTRWHLRSQQVSRRNALLATTALEARRRQRVEVDEFLESMQPRRVKPPTEWSSGYR